MLKNMTKNKQAKTFHFKWPLHLARLINIMFQTSCLITLMQHFSS